MSIIRLVRTTSLALALACAATALPARAEVEVDVALVLAVDISYSMDPDEQALQRGGFVDAFRSSIVHDAIRRGMLGRIAVTYMEWAGAWDQAVIVPWTVIDGAPSAVSLSDRLASLPTRRASRTSISGAIDFSVKLLGTSGVNASRQVIDISGDGPNNQGRPVTAARDEAVERGITINGLPIMLKRGGYFDPPDLDLYFKDCVIGGHGAFLVPARERAQFQHAIKTKIILEIAGATSPDPLIQPAQAGSARSDCLSGEKQWRDRMGN